MGSLSTAINALATSFTRDWYEPYINPHANERTKPARGALGHGLVFRSHDRRRLDHVLSRHRSSRKSASSRSCSEFSVTPTARFSAFFSAGMLTQTRGNDRGNIIAMIAGFIVVAILSGLPNNIARIVLGISDPHQYPLYPQPTWLPVMEFPWWICFGTIVTFSVAMLFRTGREHHPPGQVQVTDATR